MNSFHPKASRVRGVPAVIWIAIYFWWFVRFGLRAEFTRDDFMNAYGASARSYSDLLVDNLASFRPAPNFRPFGALVYKVSVDLFGYNLFPLRVVLLLALGAGLTTSVTAMMAAAFLFGRMAGAEGLSQIGGYRMTVSLGEYLTKTGQYLDALFYAGGWFTHGKTVALLLLVAAVARERLTARRHAWLAVTSQAALFVLAARLLLRARPDTGNSYNAWQTEYGLIRSVRQQMSRLHPRMPRQGRMLIVTDPLGQFDWASLFIARLLYRDDMLTVDRVAKMDPKPNAAAIAKYDVIMTYQDGRLIDLKPSEVRIGP